MTVTAGSKCAVVTASIAFTFARNLYRTTLEDSQYEIKLYSKVNSSNNGNDFQKDLKEKKSSSEK